MSEKNTVTHYEEAALTALKRAEQSTMTPLTPEWVGATTYWVSVAQVNATLAVMAQMERLVEK